MKLPDKCRTCVHNDHGHCFAKTWCVWHPGVVEKHKPTDMYRPIRTTDELSLDYSDGTETSITEVDES